MAGSWMVWAAVAALAASGQSTPVRRARDARCVAQDNFVSLAADESCVKYYQCYSGNAYLLQCPDNTWFNEEQQICDEGIPPNGCELAPPPTPPPETPEEPVEPEEPEDVEPAPEDENENEDLNEGDGDNEENVEDDDNPNDEHTDGSEDTTVDPEEIDDAENDHENEVEEDPIVEPVDDTDGEDQIVEPEDVQHEQEEPVDENEDGVDDQEVPINDEPIGGEQPAGEAAEGSGDPDNQDFPGEENNELPADFPEEETTDANIGEGSGNGDIRSFYRTLFSTDEHESDGEISQSQDVDFVLDELFEANIGDESYEEPSIAPVFVIPEQHVLA